MQENFEFTKEEELIPNKERRTSRRSNERFTFSERLVIERGLKEGKTYSCIGRILDRPQSSVSSEINRSKGSSYCAIAAQEDADKKWKMRNENTSRSHRNSTKLADRVTNLEMQIEILVDAIKEMKRDRKN